MQRSRIRRRIQGLPRSPIEINRSLQHLGSLRELGWHETLHRRTPTDADGHPLPWYTYPCIEWLSPRLRSSDTVFEFGAGSSTLWYADRVSKVHSVEHDSIWFSRLAATTPDNVDLRLCSAQPDEIGMLYSEIPLSSYVSSIAAQALSSLDVIVVDGLERLACTRQAVPHLKDDGLLVLDNSDRPAYRPAIEFLGRQGLNRIDFYGFWPGAGLPGCTSVFARSLERWVSSGSAVRSWGL